MMISIFKKKSKTIEEHLKDSVQKPKVNFQIDIIRNSLVEIQITRQRLLKKFGININSPEGFSISITFDQKNEEDYQRFLKSDLYSKSIHLEKFGKAYFFLCENSLQDVLGLLNQIQVSVYEYTKDTAYSYRYTKHK
ncbi:hypothetical protein L0P88_08825 [Muricauda sp. SCSIO 64092]|uniref:hypothetical protein n=1 Tax=Allomuricauda sp. SCSIO 64092 TaxID=2908842 RepID=UPI001FF57D64|nr:hypothetical protein [Muricauda sp. SCSIO 64092]UOY08642.1 hypothetical protein L0P88_08825 [Muricauda sp. SCSIO 64092]